MLYFENRRHYSKKVYKTMTVKKENKVTKTYSPKGYIRDPDLVFVVRVGRTWGPINLRKPYIDLTRMIKPDTLKIL